MPLRDFALPRESLAQGRRGDVLARCGLSAQELARQVVEAVAGLEVRLPDPQASEERAAPGE